MTIHLRVHPLSEYQVLVHRSLIFDYEITALILIIELIDLLILVLFSDSSCNSVFRVCVSVSFDECSSNSSDDVAVDESTLDEAQVDAILEAADDDSPPSGSGVLSSGRSRTSRHANGPPLRAGFRAGGGGGHGGDGRVLVNGWKKYYIDPTDVARSQQREIATAGGGAPFERGSSQRVTLPLAAGVRDCAAAGILVKRGGDQSGLPRAQAGRRSSGERVSTFLSLIHI